MNKNLTNHNITREELFRWCSIPWQELDKQPDLKTKLVIKKDKPATYEYIGNLMAEELIEHNKKGIPTKWVLPAGPTAQFHTLIDRINKEKISARNLWVFHMDEFLDWQGRPYPVGDTYESLEGTMEACFYDRIDPELTVPKEQRIWPRINDIDYADDLCEKLGGVDTVWAGVGAKGLVAFCEAPRSYTKRVSVDEYAKGKTQIVDIQEDSIIAMGERTFGACFDRIPPRGITIGFGIMLSAKRAVYMVATGSWKQTVVRVALFSEPSLEYPVTLFPAYVPDITMICDENTADHPMSHEVRGW